VYSRRKDINRDFILRAFIIKLNLEGLERRHSRPLLGFTALARCKPEGRQRKTRRCVQ
jgi:hypothetical protein